MCGMMGLEVYLLLWLLEVEGEVVNCVICIV